MIAAGHHTGDRRLLLYEIIWKEVTFMKKLVLLCTVVLLIALLAGCKAEQSLRELDKKLDAVEERIEDKGDSLESRLERTVEPKTTEGSKTQTPPTLSGIEAEDLALEHAGLPVDQVTALRSRYEIDDGIPQYDVEFYFEGWEYEYEIHAETGRILDFDRDN